MSEKTLNTRLQVKRDTKTNWDKATNFIPKDGEPIFYTDLNKMKIGDGITTVINLPFLADEFNGVICNTPADVADKIGISNHFSEDGDSISHFILTLTKGSTAEGNLTLNINGAGPKPIFDYTTDEQIVEGEFPVGDYLVYYDYDTDGYYLDYASIVGYNFCARSGEIGKTGARTIYGSDSIETNRFVRGRGEVNTSNFDLMGARIEFPQNDGSISGLAAPDGNSDATNKQYVDLSVASAMSNVVSKSGDTMSGDLNMSYHSISGIASLSGGLGWSINGDYTNIEGISNLKFKNSGMNPIIDIEANEKIQYPNERIEIHDVADPVDDLDAVNYKTYKTYARGGENNDVTEIAYSQGWMNHDYLDTDSTTAYSTWTGLLTLDSTKYLSWGHNSSGTITDRKKFNTNFYWFDADITKTYKITICPSVSFFSFDANSVITSSDSSASFTYSSNKLTFVGKLPNNEFIFTGGLDEEAGIYVNICEYSQEQDGIISGTDKTKYDKYQSDISDASLLADMAKTTADSAKTTANAALPKSGGTVTGALTLSGTLTADNTVTFTKGFSYNPTVPLYSFSMNNHKIRSLANPTVDSDAATKQYVDSVIGSVPGAAIDIAMSDTSTHAVQNKVIKAYVDDMASGGTIDPTIYEGVDLTQKFSSEIAAAPYNGNAWAWIQGRITSGNFIGIRIRDYIPFKIGSYTYYADVAGINSYKGYHSGPNIVPNHIDFITRQLFRDSHYFNPINYNNGTKFGSAAATEYPWLASDLYLWLNSLSGTVASEAIINGGTGTEVDYTQSGVYSLLPNELKAVISEKEIYAEKRYSASKILTSGAAAGWTSIGKLWLPTESEVFGRPIFADINYAQCGTTFQYPIFAGRIAAKLRVGTSTYSNWWIMNMTTGTSTDACRMSAYGYEYTRQLNDSVSYVPICFRIKADS